MNNGEENEVVNTDNNFDKSDQDESVLEESDDETLTDNETDDFEPPSKTDLERNEYIDCGGCSKILNIQNCYTCNKFGCVSHRSNCNTWFDHLKKHYFCGGFAHDFKYRKHGESCESALPHY